MGGEIYHSHAVANLRGLTPFPVCVPEVGLLNFFGGQAFDHGRLLQRRSLREIKSHGAKRYGRSFTEEKPRSRLRENTKMWNSVKASKFPGSSYTYNKNDTVTSVYHNVREGETLTSIASQYETSVEEIASANHIDNVDIIRVGQLLVVPVHRKIWKRVPTMTMDLNEVIPKDQNMLSASTVATTPENLPGAPMSSPFSLQYVKPTLLFLLFGPVLAYCLRWLVCTIRLRMDEEVYAQQEQEKAIISQQIPKHTRWHNILDDGTETNALDSSLHGYTPTDTQESRGKDAYKEICESYAELEPAYLKFLAESGLTKSGYWRGGMPSTASDENIR